VRGWERGERREGGRTEEPEQRHHAARQQNEGGRENLRDGTETIERAMIKRKTHKPFPRTLLMSGCPASPIEAGILTLIGSAAVEGPRRRHRPREAARGLPSGEASGRAR